METFEKLSVKEILSPKDLIEGVCETENSIVVDDIPDLYNKI